MYYIYFVRRDAAMDRKGPVPSGFEPGRMPAASNVTQQDLSRPRRSCLAWNLLDRYCNALESEHEFFHSLETG